MIKKKGFLPFFFILLGILCPAVYAEKASTSKKLRIVIFIHGMMSIKHHLSFENIIRFLKDDVELTEEGIPTIYATTVELMRHNPYFYQNQPMQNLGLLPIERIPQRGNASGGLAFLFDYWFTEENDETSTTYYTFGWRGLLSSKVRYKESKILYSELQKLANECAAQNITPEFVIVSYSHGGNVALNLALVQQEQTDCATPVEIEQLVLIGTPIQRETSNLIYDPMFKSIYNIYSVQDKVQVADLFAKDQCFSHRIFRSHDGCKLPDKLRQIQVKVTRFHRSAKNKPFDPDQNCYSRYIMGRSGQFRDSSPGHTELWFFGWTPVNYRKRFPLYPFPIVSFTPFIIHQCDNIHDKTTPGHPIIFDFRPEQHVVLIRNRNNTNLIATPELPFNHAQLKDTLFQYQPDVDYSEEKYRAQIHEAYKKAVVWLTQCLPNSTRQRRKFRTMRKKQKAQYTCDSIKQEISSPNNVVYRSIQ